MLALDIVIFSKNSVFMRFAGTGRAFFLLACKEKMG